MCISEATVLHTIYKRFRALGVLILEAPLIVHQQQFFDPLSPRLGFRVIYFKSRLLVLPLHKISRTREKSFKSCILKNHGQRPLLPRPTGVRCHDPMVRLVSTPAFVPQCTTDSPVCTGRPPLCPRFAPGAVRHEAKRRVGAW